MKLSLRHVVSSIALLACAAPLYVASAGCSVNAGPMPNLVFSDDGGPASSDAGPNPGADAIAPTPPAPDAATPQPGTLDPALTGTWRTNDAITGVGGDYSSFSMDAVFDASGTLALSSTGVSSSTLLPGCTEKYAASGSYTVKGNSIVTSGVPTGGDVFGKINRTGCTDPAFNVTDGTMTDSVRGALFNALAGPYVVSGARLTITMSTGVNQVFTKQ